MSLFRSCLIALLALLLAGSGIWLEGARDQLATHAVLRDLHRDQIPPIFRGPDSLYWVSYTQQMIETGQWRTRFTHMDNAPYGRPNIGWASLTSWHIIAVAKVWSAVTGMPLRDALLPAAEWANPILYLTSLFCILLVGWYIGAFPAAAIAALVFSCAPRVYFDFGFAAPDHHGWHDLTTFGVILCLASASKRTDSPRLFAVAGVLAGMALWVGATEQLVMIAAACFGATIALPLCRLVPSPAPLNTLPPASCWRLFGVTGCASSLFFYLLEYAPHPFGMHLEVNHPLFSFALLLGGEFLCRLQKSLFPTDTLAKGSTDFRILIGTGTGLIAIAALCVFGPADWHIMHLPFIRRFHEEIAEFQPIIRYEGVRTLCSLGTAGLVTAIAGALALNRKLSNADRISLLIGALPCAAAMGAAFIQLRWAGIAGAASAALAAVLFSKVRRTNEEQGDTILASVALPWAPALCAFTPVLLAVWWSNSRLPENNNEVKANTVEVIANSDIASLIHRDCSDPQRHPTVMCLGQDPRQAWLGCFGAIPSVGSLYWDNYEGLRDQVSFFATYDEEEAHRLAISRGVTHLIVGNDGGSVVAYHYILHGNRTSPLIRKTLAYRLAHPTPNPPKWLQLMQPTTPAIASLGLRIYKVVEK
jgi:hypothetical protein